jgi:hypothetical protein
MLFFNSRELRPFTCKPSTVQIKKPFGGGGRLWPPNYGSPMGTRGSPTLNPTMGLLGSSLTFVFCQRNHPIIPSQPHHSLTCHPSNIQFVHPSGYSNATMLGLLRSHLYIWGGPVIMACSAHGCSSKLLWWATPRLLCTRQNLWIKTSLNHKARDGCVVDHEVITPLGVKAPFPY